MGNLSSFGFNCVGIKSFGLHIGEGLVASARRSIGYRLKFGLFHFSSSSSKGQHLSVLKGGHYCVPMVATLFGPPTDVTVDAWTVVDGDGLSIHDSIQSCTVLVAHTSHFQGIKFKSEAVIAP